MFVADDLGAWLIGLLADAGRKKLIALVLGSDQERALYQAATAAIESTARELAPAGTGQGERLAMVVGEVFREPVPGQVLAGQATLLETLQAGISANLAVLDDPGLTGTGHSSAELLGVSGGVLAETLAGHLVLEIMLRGSRGGPLAPLADQLNHDVTHLQGQRLEGMVAQLADTVMTLTGRDSAAALPRKPVRLLPRPAFLAGREQLFTALDTRLTTGDDPWPRTVVLCGLGGVGKTSLAVAYAHQCLTEVGVAWQLAAEDPTMLAAGFSELAAQLGALDAADTRDPVTSVHALLAAFQEHWLLVFDNAPDRASVEEFLPPAGSGRVLVTSQNQHWPHAQTMQVPVLGADAAVGFLVTRTGDPDRAAAADLAGELGGLPLALEQAAAYIQATGITLARYLSLFGDRRADLLTRGEAAGHPVSVVATLGVAVSRLSGESPAAVGLLRLLACLAPEPVPVTLLLSDPPTASNLSPEPAAALGPLFGDPLAVGDAIAALRRYSLVTPAGDGIVLVHRLVRAITLGQTSEDAVGRWKQAAAALVEAATPADPELPAAWPICAVLLPHALAVLDLTSVGMSEVANGLGAGGSYAVAHDLFQLITDARRYDDAYGAEHPDTLSARSDLAYWAGAAGDAAGARDQYAALLPIQERVLGAEHPDTLATRGNLAAWAGEAGDAAGARDQYATLLPIRERLLGPEHPDTLRTRGNLATWSGRTGDVAGARDQYAALVPIFERVLGPEHPLTLGARHNRAYLTGKAGDAAGARDQFAALLPIRERLLGPEHPDTLTGRHNLATWTGEAGGAAGARDQFAALLPIRERLLGAEHPDTLTARASLATWTGRAGDAAGARDQFAALLPILERVLGTENPDTLTSRNNLARWTREAGKRVDGV